MMTDITTSKTQNAATILSDNASSSSRRSSSQTSHTSSTESQRVRTVRRPKQRESMTASPSSDKGDPSLTSFPSFSPEQKQGKSSQQEEVEKPERTISQKLRDRKATLAGLTGASPAATRQNALFDDSPRPSLDVPGSLHLVSDEHIERLIAKTGAIELIRQYAQDLALRDAEISSLRVRADNRERELKRLLREADFPSAEVERRLLRLERLSTSAERIDGNGIDQKSAPGSGLNGLMQEALIDTLSQRPLESVAAGLSERSGLTRLPSNRQQKLTGTSSDDTFKDNTLSSRNSSRTASITSQHSQDADATVRPRQVSSGANRLTGLQSIFQPPANTTSYFIGGPSKNVKKPKAVDELSVRSNQSGNSSSSWTRFFGNRSQEKRSRASSVDQINTSDITASDAATSKPLTKVRTQTTGLSSKPMQVTPTMAARPQNKRTTTATRLSTSPGHARTESNASSVPPTVELDSMIESSQLPPTMSSHNPHGILTDRFGFIYDRRRKRQHIEASQHRAKPSASESLASFRSGDISPVNGSNRPNSPSTADDDLPKKSWQEYLLPSSGALRGRPKELLAHTPSAGAVVTVSSAEAEGRPASHKNRDFSISVSSTNQKAMPSVSSVSEPQFSTVTAMSTDFAHESDDEVTDAGASKALLDQLTEMHDNLQAERTVKWNDFLRRVRAERANVATDRSANNTPEADLVNGELIGIATLGRSSKTKGKYVHFKSLVLSGIPVSLRPKIWAECSGATSLRIPGYYEDLVARSEDGSEIDIEIANQIKADVKRTLKDNTFFRAPDAPGVQRLEELLRAYSLHNPRIGYCQGMNLITASLLLICATSEDCFWLLVAIIDHILPSGYFDHSLLVARADQIVLRQYVAEVLPKLDAKLQDIGVELEACTFHWFLSLYTGVLTGGEALYRVWDVVFCLNSSDSGPMTLQPKSAAATFGVDTYLYPQSSSGAQSPTVIQPPESNMTSGAKDAGANISEEHDGTSSPFLFQLSLALLKLNESAILSLDSAATVYTYLNHNMTAHNITIDALVNASELLRSRVKRVEVLERRRKAVEMLES